MAKKRSSISKSFTNTHIVGGIFVILFAVLGVYLLKHGHAASPFASNSAASGTIGCGATTQTDGSGNKYVKFGACSSGGGTTWVGLVDGGEVNEAADAGLKYVRYSDEFGTGNIGSYKAKGIKLVLLFHGPYNTNGVVGLTGSDYSNISGVVSDELTYYKTNCINSDGSTECPAIEILNEPTQGAFWGSGHNDPTDQKAYAALIKAVYTAFHASAANGGLGSNAPILLASYDGGQAASLQWGQQGWWNPSTNGIGNMSPYVDGVTIHPYGEYSTSTLGLPAPLNNLWGPALGNRYDVTQAHIDTGKPVYITEVGWPTDVGTGSTPTTNLHTGDSAQWPRTNCTSNPNPSGPGSCSGGGPNQGDQCNNVYNFLDWAKGTGFVGGAFIFGSKDYGGSSNFLYGTADSSESDSSSSRSNSYKPSFYAVKAAANNQANPCPNPLAYPSGNTLWNQ